MPRVKKSKSSSRQGSKMRTKREYTWILDFAHGWLVVPISHVWEAGVWDEISPCSYVRGVFAYLEEDCDAPIFLKAAKKKGWDIVTTKVRINGISAIRLYDRFNKKLPPAADSIQQTQEQEDMQILTYHEIVAHYFVRWFESDQTLPVLEDTIAELVFQLGFGEKDIEKAKDALADHGIEDDESFTLCGEFSGVTHSPCCPRCKIERANM